MSVLCIIPARGGSKGIPKKNIRDFYGHPLLSWTITQAAHSSIFDKIVVDTDDEVIAKIAKKYGADVPFMRPGFLSGDKVSSEDVLLNNLNYLKKNLNYFPTTVIMLQATSPIRSKKTIKDAYKKFLQQNADSLLAVTEVSQFIWKGTDKPNPIFDIKNRLMRQDFDSQNTFFQEHGSLYIFNRKGFEEKKCRLFGKIETYIASQWEAIDIDVEDDWAYAEAKLNFLMNSSYRSDYDYRNLMPSY